MFVTITKMYIKIRIHVIYKTAEYVYLEYNKLLQPQSLNWSEIMRQKLTACTVLCLLGCILQASVKERDFSGSCHFSCTLFRLTFSLWPPCYTTCGVTESSPSCTLLRNPASVPILVLHSSSLSTSPSPDLRDGDLCLIYPLSPAALLSTLSPGLSTPSGFSHEACKNTCTFQLLCVSISALMQGCL